MLDSAEMNPDQPATLGQLHASVQATENRLRAEMHDGFTGLYREILKNESARRSDHLEMRKDMERHTQLVLEALEKVKDIRDKVVGHGDMLQDHEARLKTIEAKP